MMIAIIIALLTTFLFARFFLNIITVMGPSMSPTLREMDRILVLRYWPVRLLKKGQIVVGRFGGPHSEYCVKRIIGLPGDIISIRTSQFLNYTFSQSQYSHDTQDGSRVWYVPGGHCFVRGDNQLMSTDSTFWGPIPLNTMLGVMLTKLPRKTSDSQVPML